MEIDISAPAMSTEAIETQKTRLKQSTVKVKAVLFVLAASTLLLVGYGLLAKYAVVPSVLFGVTLVSVDANNAGAVAGVAFSLLVLLIYIDAHTENLEALKAFNDADASDCIDILNWLNYAEIAQFHQSVVNDKARKFTVAEVDAMKQWVGKERAADAEQRTNREIEAACKAVYHS